MTPAVVWVMEWQNSEGAWFAQEIFYDQETALLVLGHYKAQRPGTYRIARYVREEPKP